MIEHVKKLNNTKHISLREALHQLANVASYTAAEELSDSAKSRLNNFTTLSSTSEHQRHLEHMRRNWERTHGVIAMIADLTRR